MSAFDRIPGELQEQAFWVNWRWGDVDPKTGKRKKPPHCATDLRRHGSSTNPETWATFGQAVAVVEAGKADGIGFAMAPPYVFVDLDAELPEPERYAIARMLDSYTEESVSGTGLHVIAKASLNGGRHPEGIGVFQDGRFCYCSGKHVPGTPWEIHERQIELDAVLAEYLPPVVPIGATSEPSEPVDVDDQELLEIMFASKHGDRIRGLWDGDWSAYDSQSQGDLALCNEFAFFTNRDFGRMDMFFRRSGLMRPKWDKPLKESTYGAVTIGKAIAATTKGYDPDFKAATEGASNGLGGSESVESETVSLRDRSRNGLSDSDVRESEGPESVPVDAEGAVVTDSEAESVSASEAKFVDPSVTLGEFVSNRDETAAEPLINHERGAILTTGGLLIMLAKTGGGKTTNAVDVILHAAAGIDYPPLIIPRALRVLIIQNEGPREAFRQKLEARLAHWSHPTEAIRLWDDAAAWGSMRISEKEARTRLAAVLALHKIDLVVADSLTRFGVRGNGTPEETREFVEKLNEVGFQRDRAFLLLHHPITRPDPSLDELEQMTGAWGPHLDAVVFLKKLSDNRSRLSFPKTRWTRGDVPAVLLGFDPETEAFKFLGEETDVERDYVVEMKALLSNSKWRIPKEIAAPKPGGIGANVDIIKKVLEEHPDVFESRTGEAAKEVERSPLATVWQLRSDEKAEVGRPRKQQELDRLEEAFAPIREELDERIEEERT